MIDLGSWAGEGYRIPGEDREGSHPLQPGEDGEPENSATAEPDKKIVH